jgi:hypothetical protein
MTDDTIALQALLEKGSDTTLLREMIGFAAQRLMELVRWTPPVGQFGGLDKLGSGYRQAANFSAAGAQYASSGVPPASMECGRLAL